MGAGPTEQGTKLDGQRDGPFEGKSTQPLGSLNVNPKGGWGWWNSLFIKRARNGDMLVLIGREMRLMTAL